MVPVVEGGDDVGRGWQAQSDHGEMVKRLAATVANRRNWSACLLRYPGERLNVKPLLLYQLATPCRETRDSH